MDRQFRRECVKSYLSYVRGISLSIKAAGEMVEKYEAMADIGGVRYDGAKGSGTTGDGSGRILALMEARRDWEFTIDTLQGEYDEARRVFLPTKGIARAYLWEHYVEGAHWHAIAKRERYEDTGIKSAAYRELERVYEDLPARWKLN